MADRQLDSNGIPIPLNEAERQAAHAAFIVASDVDKTAVLVKYPFLAGRNWKQYAPEGYYTAPAQP